MSKIKKVLIVALLVPVCLFLICGGMIFGLRMYNNHKYSDTEPLSSIDVTDISQYPTDLEGIEVKHVDSGAFQGFHLIPDKKKYKGVVVCYGGSDGGPFFEMAQSYAEKGYETLAVFMFGMKNQPKELVKVPLEQFDDVLAYIDKNIKDHDIITVMGASKGAEYVLNLGVRYKEISNVVLLAPVGYCFSGLSSENYGSSSSSWTWVGKEVPYVDLNKSSFSVTFQSLLFPMITGAPVSFRDIYSSALEADEDRKEKRIPAENVKGDILMIVGEDDGMMNTREMAELIKSKKKDAVVYTYKDAGHMFSGNGVVIFNDMRTRLGGTADGNEQAMIQCRKDMDQFMSAHHTE